MMQTQRLLDRRGFVKGVLAGVGGVALGPILSTAQAQTRAPSLTPSPYGGPNVIIIRFGGGARRREAIDPAHSHSPFLLHELAPRGTLFENMEIASDPGVETGHGQGTLNILTGKYLGYTDVNEKALGERFEPEVPTLFEYLRKAHGVPSSETLIINGEDRIDEEFYSFSNHHLFGVNYRSNVLSLYRYKVHLLREELREARGSDSELEEKRLELEKMVSLDQRSVNRDSQAPEITEFWNEWRHQYRDSGLVNPRGDRVLTELAIRAMRRLRPKLMMVNYNDCDYVHWGFMSHYTRAIQIMDEGIRQIHTAVQADEAYRDNTLLVIVPDCGRDSNPFISVPCQHHFGSRSAREVFALFVGPGVNRGGIVDHRVDQTSIVSTLGRLMGIDTPLAEGAVLGEAIA